MAVKFSFVQIRFMLWQDYICFSFHFMSYSRYPGKRQLLLPLELLPDWSASSGLLFPTGMRSLHLFSSASAWGYQSHSHFWVHGRAAFLKQIPKIYCISLSCPQHAQSAWICTVPQSYLLAGEIPFYANTDTGVHQCSRGAAQHTSDLQQVWNFQPKKGKWN